MEVYETKNLIRLKSATLKGLAEHIRICHISNMLAVFGIDVRLCHTDSMTNPFQKKGPPTPGTKNG